MRASALLFSLVLLLSSWSLAQVTDKDPAAMPPTLDYRKPPFWMTTYDELKLLRKSQKDYYLKNIVPELREIPGLEKVSETELVEAAEWAQDWEKLMRRVYQACLNKTLDKECKDVAQVRVKAIQLHGNEKLENRQAGGTSTSSDKSKSSSQKNQ